MLSELSIITFDGNSAALSSKASYILVRIPGEIVVVHIEKCSLNQNGNAVKKPVDVDSIVVPLPFSSQELFIEDSGTMYVITTPAGLIIKWAHLTGIIDIHFSPQFNLSSYTEGLCGICNDDPDDDLRMQNGTVITNMEDIELFIGSWEVEKSFEVTMRRPVRNCTEYDCSHCIELLNRDVFILCRDKVSPRDFCEKMWLNYTYLWSYECDAISAYVALCNKFDICIQWRTPDYCRCTDNEDQPHSVGEIWNGGVDECALYKCLEDGSIIPVEPVCEEEPSPICEREAEVVMGIIDELTCCSKEVCGCDMTLCDKTIPVCTSSQKLIVGYSALSCCPQYECVCETCSEPTPQCTDGEFLTVDLNTTHLCCPQYYCGKHVDFCLLECNCENLVIPICEVHQMYTPAPSDYDCCGTCKNISCKFHMENGTSVIYENEGIVKLYNEGCCKICKREERMCQKVIIKSMIKKQDCVSQTSVDVSNDVYGTGYDVTLSSISATTYSSPVSRTVTTNVTKPGPPVFLAGERVGSAGILLSWNTPPNPNGRILSYVVKYKEVCPWMQTAYTRARAKPDSLEVLLTNLNPGTTYEIKVAAENSAGIGVFSDPFLFQTAESAPGKVVNLTVEALNYSAVNLIWYLPRQPNGKITSFKISVKHARSGIIVKDVSIKVEDILTGKLPECNENSESFLWSTSSPSPTLSRVTPPLRTTHSSSTLARNKISSVWKEPVSFVVTHLRPYTTYLFEVSAVTTEAGYIDSTIVRTPESVPEGPPQNCVTGNITGKAFSISWDPPTIVTGKFSYRVELYGPSGRILDNSTKDLRFAFTHLTPFTMYDVYVAAETSAGVGPKSNLSVFTPPDVPGAVFDLQITEVEATEIRITWRKPRQPNGIINQYRVKVSVLETGVLLENTLLIGQDEYISSPISPEMMNLVEPMIGFYEGSAEISSDLHSLASFIYNSHPYNDFPGRTRAEDQSSPVVTTKNQYITDITAEQLSYVIRRLVPFTEHTVSVSAFTIMGEGPPTVLTVRTREQVPSSIQTINYKNISSSSILLYWDPPEYPNGKITHYTIYAMELDTHRAFQMTTVDTSFLITGLKKYTRYKMRVAASTHVGEGSLSEENDIFVRTPEDEPESSPQDVKVTDVSPNEMRLQWSPPEKPNGIIIAYEVLYQNTDTLFLKNTSTTNIILSDLKPYTLYNISVWSYTRVGHGNQSSSVLSIRTSETVPGSAPENITYKNISSREIEISFLPPSSPNGIIQKYTIYLKRNNDSEARTVNTTSLTQNIRGLKKYTHYVIEVSASTLKGEGVRSLPISILTEEDAPDSPPQNFSVKQLSGVTVMLSWQPPLEPNGIILYYTVYVW
ncbi:phosphotidylinositol phosphatase PTPRQ-like protein [Cricetulus griseus]|nr:phosphotidylinositol phosphatase PTPRQ-like protein [Cricetulus griseus]